MHLRYFVIVKCVLSLLFVLPVLPAAIISTLDHNEPPPAPSQNATAKVLQIGRCTSLDERIYTDNTLVENSGPSTLNGTMEVSKTIGIESLFDLLGLALLLDLCRCTRLDNVH